MSTETEYKSWKDYKEAVLEGLNEKQTQMLGFLMEQSHKENITAVEKGGANEANAYIVEAEADQDQLTESTATGSTVVNNISRYDMMFMPLIRRSMPALLAMDLVGVQPQSGPRGIVRTLRFRYSEDTDDTSTSPATDEVDQYEEASGWNVYEKYSKLVLGGDYQDTDALDPFAQTQYLEGDRGKPMDLEVVTQATETMSRKLAAAYSLESGDDLMYLDGVDIESELNQSLGDEIMRELDRELITKLESLAGISENVDFANIDGRYAGEKLSALTIHADDLSGRIAVNSRKSSANWMVVSQRVFTGLKNAANSAFVPANQGKLEIASSLYVGDMGNIRVYVDPYASGDTLLLGYKGSDIDAGLIYAPYIALASSGVVRNPETGDNRIMLRTRYALHEFTDTNTSLGNSPDYYARSTVANLQLGFVNSP